MSESSRRNFLALTGAGAVAGTAVLTSGLASSANAAPSRAGSPSGSATGSMVAYVEDHRSGKLRLMVGEREVVVHDRDLVARLLRAAGGK